MSEEFKDFTATPTLTFDPLPTKEEIIEPKPQEPEKTWNDDILSAEEIKMVDEFAQQIDLNNSNAILQYGAGTQKKMADFSEGALENVKTKDLGEIGDLLSNVVSELKSFDVEEEEKGFLGFFKKKSNKITAMKTKFDKTEVNIDKICQVLEKHQIQL